MIKGITPRLAEAGKIKIGGLGPERESKNKTKYRLPQKLDHFLITHTERNEAGDLEIDGEIMKNMERDSDKKIRAIPIILHSDNIDEVFPTSYALYSGRRCACRGDGEKALRREIKEKQYTGESKTIECPCPYLQANEGPKCKPNGKLFCSIAVPNSSIAGAVHIWRTTSMISINQMIGSLLQIQTICGTLRGLPLWLRVKPITVEPPGQGALTVYCCHVELRAADIIATQHKALEAAKLRRELGGDDLGYRKMLMEHDQNETVDEQEAIAAEFYAEDSSNVSTAPAGTSAGDIAAKMEKTGEAPAADNPDPISESDKKPDDII